MTLQEIVEQARNSFMSRKINGIYYLTIECTDEEYKNFAREVEKLAQEYKPIQKQEMPAKLPPGVFLRYRNFNGVPLEIRVNYNLKHYRIGI